MVSQFYAPIVGGEERAVEDLSTALVRRGHSVAVATLATPGSAPSELRDEVRVHRIRGTAQRAASIFSEGERRHAPPAPDPEAALALWRLVRAERPDVVHAHNWLVHSLVPLKRRLEAPLVLSLHDHSLVCSTKRLMRGSRPCAGPGVRKCLACASEHYGTAKGVPTVASVLARAGPLRRAVDMFLPVSHAVAEKSQLPSSGVPYEVVPNIAGRHLFDAHRPGDGVPEGLPEPGFLLYVGDLTPDKGVEVLLEAYAGLPEAPPLVLIGRPYAYADRDLPAGVLVLGMRSHATVVEAWRRCSIGVVPSVLCEAFGIAALEAMAVGRPVVAARSGGLADLVVDGETGFLVPSGDARELRDAVRRLLADGLLRTQMGDAGRRRAESVFAEPAVLSRLEQAYDMVAGHRPWDGDQAGPAQRPGFASRAVR
jgi:glycosyltransferase involved in cell wall biosynthesis